MTRLLFENLPLLLVSEAVALAVVLAVHRRWYTPRSRRMVWVAICVCVALVVMQKLVVTDREKIKVLVNDLARAVDQGDIAALGQQLDDDFESDRLDKQAFLDQVNLTLQRWQVDEASVWGFDIEVRGDTANAAFGASCDLRGSEMMQYRFPSRWEIDCVRRADTWKVTRVQALKLGMMDIKGLRNILRY